MTALRIFTLSTNLEPSGQIAPGQRINGLPKRQPVVNAPLLQFTVKGIGDPHKQLFKFFTHRFPFFKWAKVRGPSTSPASIMRESSRMAG
jgi:hypothetical protein